MYDFENGEVADLHIPYEQQFAGGADLKNPISIRK